MCSQKQKNIQNLNQKIESTNNKFSYNQLVFGITTLFVITCCLILIICLLQINIWVLQENNCLLNLKIEALLVEQQSEAEKNALISKTCLLVMLSSAFCAGVSLVWGP